MKELQGKVSLVTGATRGIGHAIAIALAEAGSDVLFIYRHSTEQAAELEKTLRDKGVRSRGYQADAASETDMDAVASKAQAEFGQISIIVNNAGITRDKSFLKMTREMW